MDSLRDRQIREILDYDKNISRVWYEREVKQARAYDLQYNELDEVEKETMFTLEEHLSDLRGALQEVIDTRASGGEINNSLVSAIFTNYNTTVRYLKTYLNSGKNIAKRDINAIDEKFQELVPLFDQAAQLLNQEGEIHNKTVMEDIEGEIKNRQYNSAFDFKRIGIPVDAFKGERQPQTPMPIISPNSGNDPTPIPKTEVRRGPIRKAKPPPPAPLFQPFDTSAPIQALASPEPINKKKTTATEKKTRAPPKSEERTVTPSPGARGSSTTRIYANTKATSTGKGKYSEEWEPFHGMSSIVADTTARPLSKQKDYHSKKSRAGKLKEVDQEFNGSGSKNDMFY